MATNESSRHTEPVIVYEDPKQPVRLVYDTWTPRPHFIFEQTRKTKEATPKELQATYELIGWFLGKNPVFDQEAVLSFHRGRWYKQNTPHWHAHLCVPYDPYLASAQKAIKSIPGNNQWKSATTVQGGMSDWQKQMAIKYKEYQTECVAKNISTSKVIEGVTLSTLDSQSQNFKLAWTSPTPRIAIIVQGSAVNTATLASLYDFMSAIRIQAERALSQLDGNFRNFGCHLCLHVRGQSGTTVTCRTANVLATDGTITANANVVGYIQMDESQYLQWLPGKIRENWREQFRRTEHFVRT